MTPSEALSYVAQLLEQLGIPYMVTGSVASLAYGEARFTNDVDIVIDLPDRLSRPLVRGFPESDFYVSEAAVRDAVRCHSMFKVIHMDSGMKVEFVVRKPGPFDTIRFERRVRFSSLDGVEAMFSSPEDVILKKLEFYREGASEKHLRDIASILRARRDQLDLKYVRSWATRLQVHEIWDEVLRAVDEREKDAGH